MAAFYAFRKGQRSSATGGLPRFRKGARFFFAALPIGARFFGGFLRLPQGARVLDGGASCAVQDLAAGLTGEYGGAVDVIIDAHGVRLAGGTIEAYIDNYCGFGIVEDAFRPLPALTLEG